MYISFNISPGLKSHIFLILSLSLLLYLICSFASTAYQIKMFLDLFKFQFRYFILKIIRKNLPYRAIIKIKLAHIYNFVCLAHRRYLKMLFPFP